VQGRKSPGLLAGDKATLQSGTLHKRRKKSQPVPQVSGNRRCEGLQQSENKRGEGG